MISTFIEELTPTDDTWNFGNKGVNRSDNSIVIVGMSETFELNVEHFRNISFCSVTNPQNQKRLTISYIKDSNLKAPISRY